MGVPPLGPTIAPGQTFGQNPTKDLPPDHPLIRQFGNYQPFGHSGVDYPAALGTPVYATEDGLVTWAAPGTSLPGDNSRAGYISRYYLEKEAAGNIVAIEHTALGGYITLTYHLDRFAPGLAPGQRVKRGQLIGYCGTTGRSTGPHAHLDVIPTTYPWDNGHFGRVNPAPYLTDAWPTTPTKEPIMPNFWVPGAVRKPQPLAVTLDTTLPPRATWHITSDVDPGKLQPPFVNVARYLTSVNYCPHLMWDPFTGYMEQYYPANVGSRALAAWNQDGRYNFQIEVLFSAGAIRDGKRYEVVGDTPLKNFHVIMTFLDQLGIPRTWPMGPPPRLHSNSPRTVSIWNTQAGHYGHVHVPNNDHTDPGIFPPLTGGKASPPVVTPQTNLTPLTRPANGIHIAVKGDTPRTLATRYGVRLDALLGLNLYIKNPDYLAVGDRVRIPLKGSVVYKAVLPGVPAYVHQPGIVHHHTVAKGQTLGAIAKHYGANVDWLVKVNNLPSADKINVGQKLRVR